MEPRIRAFFVRIANTVFLILFWMSINTTAGIMYGLGFWDDGLVWPHILFYLWLLLSGGALAWYLITLWRKPLPED